MTPPAPDEARLQPNQREVLRMARAGKSSHEIAEIRGTSVQAVWDSRSRLRAMGFDLPRPRGRGGGVGAGELNGAAKLTESAVREIRASAETSAALARRFGVCRQAVSAVRHGRAWADVR